MKLRVIAMRNVMRNRRRSLLSIIAIAVAALAITMLFSIFEGIQVDVQRNSWNYESGQVRIRNADFERYEYLNPVQYVVPEYEQLIARLQGLPEVAAVSPRINISAVAFRDSTQIGARGIGIDFERERDYQNLESIVARGRLPEPGTSEALVGFGLAEDLGVNIGDQATFLTQTRLRTSNAFTIDVVGLANFPVGGLNQRAFMLPIDSAGRYLRMEGAASDVLIKGSGVETSRLLSAVERIVAEEGPEGMTVQPWSEISGGYSYIQVAGIIYNIMALFFFLLGSTVVVNTTMMTIHERTNEIGTLSAMGMHSKELVRLFFTEAAYLGIAGSAVGVLLGMAITIPLQQVGIDFGQAMDMVDMDMGRILYPVLNVRSTVVVFFYSSIVAMLASFVPARRAAKLKPVEALRQ